MKLHILSDLHLEFGGWDAPVTDADVIVLAGDIGSHTHGLDWAVAQPAFAGKPILYVAGNHEFYGAELLGLRKQIHLKAADLQAAGHRIHVLDNAAMEIDGVRFLGATLWTDYRLFGDGEAWSYAMKQAKHGLTDHSVIFYVDRGETLDSYAMRSRLFLPEHAYRLNRTARNWLTQQLALPFTGKTVVITHHLPSRQSVAERFDADILSAAFASSLDSLVEQADLWIHGHTHDAFDYYLGKCRVVCNPKGYPREIGTGFRPDLVVTVEAAS